MELQQIGGTDRQNDNVRCTCVRFPYRYRKNKKTIDFAIAVVDM